MKYFVSLALSTLLVSQVNATVHTVTCQNTPSHFLPITVNAVVGDTIHWTWIAGGHIVGPIGPSYIPDSAAMWYATIDGSHLSFDYVVTREGVYSYQCHPSNPHGEYGYINVTAVGIQEYAVPVNSASAFPNPFSSTTTLQSDRILKDATITVYNAAGRVVKQLKNISGQAVALSRDNLPSGLYFLRITQDSKTISTTKLVIAD